MRRLSSLTVASAILAAALAAAPLAAQTRVCIEELAGTCLKYADPPAGAPAAPARVTSPAEREEQALGLTAADRRRVQSGLRAAGAYSGGIDGAFGPGTRRGISAWQQSADRKSVV